MKVVACLKAFFESEPHGRKITMDELRDLSKEERQELATLAAEALEVELELAA
jgi:hypothetical protein